MITKSTAEQCGITGFITADIFDTTAPKAAQLEREIEHHVAAQDFLSESDPVVRERLQRFHNQTYLEMIADLKRLFKVREYASQNLIVTVGRSALAQRLANTTTYTGIINYGALGSSSTAAANGDTQLGTEVFRKVTASTSYTTNQAFIDFFYSKSDTNGTYQEFGTFIDGTGAANSGQMFTHLITGGWTKSSSESMTVACTYTIS